jgi:hypothetical protein
VNSDPEPDTDTSAKRGSKRRSPGSSLQPDEVQTYWQRILVTLRERGVLRKRPKQGGYLTPQVMTTLVLPDRVVFILDMQRLAGIAREIWTDDRALWKQWRAALEGRIVFVTDSAGLAITVARDPELGPRPTPTPERLPATIPLTQDDLPERPYHVRLGYGPGHTEVDLDLAGRDRAILVGGTSGYGKTTFLLSVLVQMARKHNPDTLRLAVIDLKGVDFTGPIARLSHHLCPVATDIAEAGELIERVEAERLRRRHRLQEAEVSDWLTFNARSPLNPIPLMLFVVDEAADLADTSARETLNQIARKGRATGISVIVGTQHPTAEVIDTQVKTNLPTAIAFRTKSSSASRVILDQGGAEKLRVPGRARIFHDGWQTVQTLYVDREGITKLLGKQKPAPQSILSEDEAFLVRLSLDELDGDFTIQRLYKHPRNQTPDGYRVSKHRLTQLAQRWERRGWLTHPPDAVTPRRVTETLIALLPPDEGAPGCDT